MSVELERMAEDQRCAQYGRRSFVLQRAGALCAGGTGHNVGDCAFWEGGVLGNCTLRLGARRCIPRHNNITGRWIERCKYHADS